ncbi:MAG: FtsW/RodA/SpoVE family cell cycle protein [Oscillospiraceae bacterium]|nr:FtsW/RodA/SpoVE family cell cycle protein [Oscillospiraceae bacterium]
MASGQKAKTKKNNSLLNLFVAKGSVDIPFFLLLMTIVTAGLVMVFSASYTYSYYHRGGSTVIFTKQLIFVAIGLVLMWIVSRVRYEYFRYFAILIAGVSVALLVLVLFLPEYRPGFKRWINLGFTTFQPSEIAKLGLIILLAFLLEKDSKIITGKIPSDLKLCRRISGITNGKLVIYKSFTTVIFYGIIIMLFAGLVYLENHVSGTILILGLGVIMLFMGEVKNKWFYIIGAIALLLIAVLIINPQILAKYAGERIVAWLDKDYSPMGARWQTNNSLYAIGSGGLTGTGLGQSKQKHLYVAEPQNDFIFAIVCEELGFIGAAAIIILFALFIYRGIKIGLRAKDKFSSLLVMGIAFQIGIQVALNIAVVSDFMPNTGISLPFFSAGGTSVVILLMEMGMILSVSRSITKKE